MVQDIFLTVVDYYSRFTWAICMKNKNEATELVQYFCAMVKTQFGKPVKIIRIDNGPEFDMKSFHAKHGIIHQRSCVETPQQNGIVERKHQHILNVARCFKLQSGMPVSFWTYFISHVVHIINRIPILLLHDMSPFEKLYNKKPYYSTLRSFGCLSYVSTLNRNRTTFDARFDKGVFIGFETGMKGYKIYCL